jgi:hypothetical protein
MICNFVLIVSEQHSMTKGTENILASDARVAKCLHMETEYSLKFCSDILGQYWFILVYTATFSSFQPVTDPSVFKQWRASVFRYVVKQLQEELMGSIRSREAKTAKRYQLLISIKNDHRRVSGHGMDDSGLIPGRGRHFSLLRHA